MSDTFTLADMTALREDLAELKQSMKEVAKALERLARLEERHAGAQVDLDRAFDDIRDLKTKVATLELSASSRKSTNALVDKAIYAALGLLAAIILRKVGLI